MTELDYEDFDQAFKRLVGYYRLKMRTGEQVELSRTYFRLLEDHPLDVVLLAGKQWMGKHRRFPKAVEWREVIETGNGPSAPATARQMSTAELEEYAAAERDRFAGQLCLCSECCRAGVDDLPMRFVPTLIAEDEHERAYNPQRQRMQIAGHWAHGEELRRWYDARDAFYALAVKHPRVLPLVLLREPGEEG